MVFVEGTGELWDLFSCLSRDSRVAIGLDARSVWPSPAAPELPWEPESSRIQSHDDPAKRLNLDVRIDNDARPASQLDLNPTLRRMCCRALR